MTGTVANVHFAVKSVMNNTHGRVVNAHFAVKDAMNNTHGKAVNALFAVKRNISGKGAVVKTAENLIRRLTHIVS